MSLSNAFEIPKDYVKTSETCYVEPVTEVTGFDYADILANGLNIGDCLEDISVALTGPIVAGAAGFFTTTTGFSTVVISSPKPFDMVLEFTSVNTNERINLNTAPDSIDLNGVGVSLGGNAFHNGNSNTPVFATYTNVTEIEVAMQSNNGTGSGLIFNTVTQRRRTSVHLLENQFNRDLEDILVAGCTPDLLGVIPAIPPEWTVCPADDFGPSTVILGPVSDRDFRWLELDGLYHDAQGNTFTRDQTLASGYLAYHGMICNRPAIEWTPFSTAVLALGDVGHSVDVGTLDMEGGNVVGAVTTEVIEFTGPGGVNYSAELSVERLSLNGASTFTGATSNLGNSGPGDYRVRIKALPDFTGNIPALRWMFNPSSAQPGENIQVALLEGDTLPIDYIAGPGTSNHTQAMWDTQTGGFGTVGTTGFVWFNGNNSNPSSFLFEGDEIQFRINAAGGIGVGGRIYVQTGPDPDNFDACEVINTLRAQVSNTVAPSGSTVLFASTVSGDVNAANEIKTLTQVAAGVGWSLAANNEATFTGSPSSVDVLLNVFIDGIVGQRATPRLQIERDDGAGFDVIAIGDVYIRDASGAEEGNISIAYTDPTPGTNPIYRIRSQQGATPGNVANATDDETSFSLRAWV